MSGSHLPHGLIAYGPNANCTMEICPIEYSVYQYRPNLGANIAFLILFAITLLMHLWRGIVWREWFFMWSMILGCISEIIGYAGRLMLWQNPFSFVGFMVQICCITFAPVFYCAAIYVLLARIVNHLDPSLSRFPPKAFYWFFIPCDIVSLALQGAGGGLSSSSTGQNSSGVNISVAGLSFQVVTLFIFSVCCVDYGVRYYRSTSRQPVGKNFKIFTGFLAASVVLIFIRCAYRIEELREGYRSSLISNQGMFIALEGVMILIAVLTLFVAHPGPGLMGERRKVTDQEKRLGSTSD